MTTFDDIKGLQVVGYRYGEAPESGRSYNFRDRFFEDGVSMAQVLYCKPCGSFAAQGERKYYYSGVISGIGSDDEICITDIKRISYKDYIEMRKSLIAESNAIVNYEADRKLRSLYNGYNVGTEEEIEAQRAKYLRKL